MVIYVINYCISLSCLRQVNQLALNVPQQKEQIFKAIILDFSVDWKLQLYGGHRVRPQNKGHQ